MAELVDAVDVEICDIKELCEIDDDTIELLFDKDLNWKNLVEDSLDDVDFFEDEVTLEC